MNAAQPSEANSRPGIRNGSALPRRDTTDFNAGPSVSHEYTERFPGHGAPQPHGSGGIRHGDFSDFRRGAPMTENSSDFSPPFNPNATRVGANRAPLFGSRGRAETWSGRRVPSENDHRNLERNPKCYNGEPIPYRVSVPAGTAPSREDGNYRRYNGELNPYGSRQRFGQFAADNPFSRQTVRLEDDGRLSSGGVSITLDGMEYAIAEDEDFIVVTPVEPVRRLKENHLETLTPELNGRRRALLIGINYDSDVDPDRRLSGAVNDVRLMREFLMRKFNFTDIHVLTDEELDFTDGRPTKSNILEAMGDLVKDASAGDSLFFHFSGHGDQLKDEVGDEYDGWDESILPVDYKENGQIRDDKIYEILVRSLNPHVRLTAVIDCCRSGTVLDLPFLFAETGPSKVSNRNEELAGDAFSFSGCRDSEDAAEISDPMDRRQSVGKLVHSFISTLESANGSRMSYAQVYEEVTKRSVLGRVQQTPQLTMSRPIDLHSATFQL